MIPNAKDRLIDTALTLFHQEGFHATGIDRILKESNVSKMTLYKYFKSKEDLIVAVLWERDLRFRRWMEDRTSQGSTTPADRLLKVYDALDEWFETPTFSGCLFINAAAEYAAPQDKIHEAAVAHKKLVVDWLTGLTQAAGATDPQGLAWDLMLIMEGAIAARQASGQRDAAKMAKNIAASILISRVPAHA